MAEGQVTGENRYAYGQVLTTVMNIKRKSQLLLSLFLAALTLGPVTVSSAQDIEEPVTSPPDTVIDAPESLEKIDQRTPLSTMQGFMRSAEYGEYEIAAQYLDLRYLPKDMSETDGAMLAEKLYIVITRAMSVDFGAFSDRLEGISGDSLPVYRDILGEIQTNRGKLALYLQLVPGENEMQVWKISNSSVARIPRLYDDYGYSPFVEKVRSMAPAGSFLGTEFFKWIIAVTFGVVAAATWILVVWLFFRFVTKRISVFSGKFRRYLTRPIPAVIFVGVGFYVLSNLGLGITAQRISRGGTLVTLVTVWLLFATVDLLRDMYGEFLNSRRRESGLMLLRPVTSTIKAVIAMLALVMWLDNMGVNITALVAGLGVGGLAVALVLQKPLEDIMGAITLYTQQPVSVGQFCTSGNVTGTVEEINLRTTRVRTVKNTVVVIPNAVFATAVIENITERQQILHRQTVRLALVTSATVLQSVLEGLREVLATVETVNADSSRVRLIGFGEFSIDIEVFAHVGTTVWTDFLAIAENINLDTVRVLEQAGAKLAEPPR